MDAGLGITVMPALATQVLPDGVRPIPVVRPAPTRTIYVKVRKSIDDSSPALLVLDTVASVVARAPQDRVPR